MLSNIRLLPVGLLVPGLIGSLLFAIGCSGEENAKKTPPPAKQIQEQIAQAKQSGEGQSAKPSTKPAAKEDAPLLTEAEVKEGWIALFDGETLFGWTQHSKETADWKVHKGAIVVGG